MAFAAAAFASARVEVSAFPQSECADTEVSTNVALPFVRAALGAYSPHMAEWMSPSPSAAATSLSTPSATPAALLTSGSSSRNSSSMG